MARATALTLFPARTRRTAANFNSIAYSACFRCDMRSSPQNCHRFPCLTFGVHSRFLALLGMTTSLGKIWGRVPTFCLGINPLQRTVGLAHLHVPCKLEPCGRRSWVESRDAGCISSRPAKLQNGPATVARPKGELKIPTLTSQNKSEVGVGLFPRR
jgi:hypothetical protein